MKEEQILIDNKVEVLEHKEDVIWSMDRDYRLTAYNSSFEKKFGEKFRSKPEIGMDMREVYNDSGFFSLCRQGCDKALERYATTSRHTFLLNGSTIVHEFSFEPFMDE